MAHIVTFEDFGGFSLLSQQDVIDLIDLFYRWGDARFHVIGSDGNANRRGSHLFNRMSGTHVITLNRGAIERGVKLGQRMGGNGKAPDPRTGAAMVLAHELQHANQSQQHASNEIFYRTKQYNKRPCERDARAFVDEHLVVIYDFVGLPRSAVARREPTKVSMVDPAQEVAELFEDLTEVSVDDIREELRQLKGNNPTNFLRVKELLGERGVRILTA